MHYTGQDLQDLPQKDAFRLRSAEMTRLETFSDAAFAFAMTMLVISLSSIPGNYQELVTALKGVPAFAASFALIMLFWVGHRRWSRRYGLEGGLSTVLTLVLIFIMLVYVYPLKLMFSTLFAWLSRGWLPSEFAVNDATELVGLFAIYGIGAGALAGALALLYLRARSVAEALQLNSIEQIRTSSEIVTWTVQSATGFVSAAIALFLPLRIGAFAAFAYCSLPITMPIISIYFARKIERETDEIDK